MYEKGQKENNYLQSSGIKLPLSIFQLYSRGHANVKRNMTTMMSQTVKHFIIYPHAYW
jgi:hypothetical protein